MTTLLSIDPSTSILGWAIFENSKYKESGIIKTKEKDSKECRIEQIRKYLENMIIIKVIKVVVIEDYSYGSKGRGIYTIGELGGVIRNLFYRNDIPVYAISPNEIKKFVAGAGKGTCKKNLMLLKAYQKFGMEFEDDNECDAFCAGKCYLKTKKNGDKK